MKDTTLTPWMMYPDFHDRLAAHEREMRRQEELGILDAAWQQEPAPSPVTRLRQWLRGDATRRDSKNRGARRVSTPA